MALFMETTKIEAMKTVAEIQSLLGASGCSGVMTTYENKDVVAISFQVTINSKNIAFKLPCRWKPIYNKLFVRIKKARQGKLEDLENQAKRVAWRQLLRWVEAQLALVDTVVKIDEVFMPYIQIDLKGKTLYEKISEGGFKTLGHSKEE